MPTMDHRPPAIVFGPWHMASIAVRKNIFHSAGILSKLRLRVPAGWYNTFKQEP